MILKRSFCAARGNGARALRTHLLRVSTWSVCAGAVVLGGLRLSEVARAEVPAAAAAPAGDMKPFVQKVTGTDVSFEMEPIPGGKFKMGSPATEKGHKPDEAPQFEVQVDPFYMEQHEVTWAEYGLYLANYQKLAAIGRPVVPQGREADAVTYPTPMYELEAGPILDRMGRGPEYPAVIMSQYAAKQYTKWLSKRTGHFYRLPTEAEWEYACRAGTTTAYSFGDDPKKLGDYAWTFDNSADKDNPDGAYHKIMSKKPNPWGLYDMHGNVAEYVIDKYDAGWYKKFDGKTVDWKDAINWPDKQYPRLARGGSWNDEADACRSASRREITEKENVKDPQLPKSPHWMTEGFWIGFRVMSPAKEPSEAEKLKYWDVDNDYVKKVLERDREIRALVGAEPEPGKKK